MVPKTREQQLTAARNRWLDLAFVPVLALAVALAWYLRPISGAALSLASVVGLAAPGLFVLLWLALRE